MPSVSKKQHNFMAAVAKNPAFAKKAGVPRSVGEEFLQADKGKKFQKGGYMKGESPVQKKAKAGAKMVKMARGGGVEVKGKTKGKMIAMAGGKGMKMGGKVCK